MLIQKLYNPLTRFVKWIIKMVRQSLVLAFGLVIIAIFSTIGVIMYPLLFFTPPNWEVALSRFLMALLPLLVLIGILVFLWISIEKMDKEKEDKDIERDIRFDAIIKKLGITKEELEESKRETQAKLKR